jgi:hypothetical protein
MLCELMELAPARMFGSGITMFPRMDPVGAEQFSLELEERLNPGEVKRVVFPLFTPPLMCDALIMLHSTRGFYRRFFSDQDKSAIRCTTRVLYGRPAASSLILSPNSPASTICGVQFNVLLI